MGQREAFEKRYVELPRLPGSLAWSESKQRYMDPSTRREYSLWQAARRDALEEAALTVETSHCIETDRLIHDRLARKIRALASEEGGGA